MESHSPETQEKALTAEAQIAQIFAWRRGFNAMHLIDLGLRLGLFRAFADHPGATVQEVADHLNLYAPYVERWCLTAYGFELLEATSESGLCLAPFLDAILADPTHPYYLGGYVQLGAEFATEDFQRCREAFRSGETVAFQGRSEAFTRVVAETTRGLQVLIARKIFPSLPGLAERLAQGGLILEVGCGVGNLLLQLTQAFPQSRCMGIEIDPIGLATARSAVNAAGVADRVELHAGRLEDVVSPQLADAVVMVEVLHEVAPALRPSVLQGCARALRLGGWLVILDETYPATLAETRQAEFRFALQTGFEELLWGNVIPTRPEQERLLRAAGFSGEINRTLLGEGFTLLTTQQP